MFSVSFRKARLNHLIIDRNHCPSIYSLTIQLFLPCAGTLKKSPIIIMGWSDGNSLSAKCFYNENIKNYKIMKQSCSEDLLEKSKSRKRIKLIKKNNFISILSHAKLLHTRGNLKRKVSNEKIGPRIIEVQSLNNEQTSQFKIDHSNDSSLLNKLFKIKSKVALKKKVFL